MLDENFLLINKPAGWTSFDAVNFIRKKLRQQKSNQKIASSPTTPTPRNNKIRVGHAGTLDPFATGLLIIGIGREATKRLDEFKKLPKTYIAEIHLGATSDTDDCTGVIVPFVSSTKNKALDCHPELDSGSNEMPNQVRHDNHTNTQNHIEKILKTFLGPQTQIPPMYSAKKIAGQRLYQLARAGQTVDRAPCPIEIYDIKLLEYTWPLLKIEVQCSAGTYIRTLARDIGDRLGTGAYCETLCRTKIGPYDLKNAQAL